MERELQCIHFTTAAKAVRGTNPLHNTFESIKEAIDVADCCREGGLFDIASELMDLAKTFTISASGTLKKQIDEQCSLIAAKDCSSLAMNASDETRKPPPIWIMGWNFASSMARWASSGFPLRTEEEIAARMAICRQCEFLVNEQCTQCGCSCNERNLVLNKLAIATDKCPKGKWD